MIARGAGIRGRPAVLAAPGYRSNTLRYDGARAAVDQVAHEPEAILAGIVGDPPQQALERLEAAVDVADRVGRHRAVKISRWTVGCNRPASLRLSRTLLRFEYCKEYMYNMSRLAAPEVHP